jgi:hypothetical protein
MTGLCLALAILFVEETYYDRRLSPQQQPHKTSRLLRLVGVEQYRSRRLRNTFLQAVMRPIKVLAKPTVFVSCVYYCLTFAWVVGMQTLFTFKRESPSLTLHIHRHQHDFSHFRDSFVQFRTQTNWVLLFHTNRSRTTG